MIVVQKSRPPAKAKAKSAKPKESDSAKLAKATAKAKAGEERKTARERADKAKAAAKATAAAEKAAKAKAAEEKKVTAAADRTARAKAAEQKRAKAAADKAAKAAAKLALPKTKPRRKKSEPGSSPEPLTLDSIEKQIREAYLRETRGALKERVLLKDLRPKVGVQSQDFDQALLGMQQQGKVVLMGLDNPVERTPEVEAAALHIAGRPRYLVYFQG